RLLAWRTISGAMFGGGLASLAEAASGAPAMRSYGPQAIELFGYQLPLLSALFGLIGVILARMVAPVSPAAIRLGRTGNLALTALLALGVLAFVIAGEKRPIVALGWAVGLGYSGVAFIELVSRAVMSFSRLFLKAFVNASLTAASSAVEPVNEELS
ncbi:MAG: hypothetical protein ABIO43_10990, partial [Sphingomicrobium sp.]